MYWEFGTVFMLQNILLLAEDHCGSAGGGSFNREDVLWTCWDVQGAPQRCGATTPPAVDQTHLRIPSALCHSTAPGAIRRLHAVRHGLEAFVKLHELGDVCDDM